MQLSTIILGLGAISVLFFSTEAAASIGPFYDYYPDNSPTPPIEPQTTDTPFMGTNYDQYIALESNPPPQGLSQADFIRLINAVIQIESSWNPSAVSGPGAIGLMQVMPANAIAYGYQPDDLYNPAINIKVGTDILRTEINKYGLTDGLAAYNGGPNGRKWASTQAYAQKVLGVYNA